MTPFQLHVQRWGKGCGSDQCPGPGRPKTAVCLARGTYPCDVLFVGEAPGKSENSLGVPFVGPAGNLLNEIIREGTIGIQVCTKCREKGLFELFRPSIRGGSEVPTCDYGHMLSEPPRIAFTNIVGCFPHDSVGKKIGEPEEEQIQQCKPRLEEFISIVNPRLIIQVGRLAEKWLEQGYMHSVKIPFGTIMEPIMHPAAILRMNAAQKPLAKRRCVLHIEEAIQRITPERPKPQQRDTTPAFEDDPIPY